MVGFGQAAEPFRVDRRVDHAHEEAPQREQVDGPGGAAAGVILFFTCVSAVFAPMGIGAIGDAMGHISYGFWLATGFAALLFVGAVTNWLLDPTRVVLERLDAADYQQVQT